MKEKSSLKEISEMQNDTENPFGVQGYLDINPVIQEYQAKNSDLNGTWISDWYLRANFNPEKVEEEYSWGKAVIIYYETFEVDISANTPFIVAPGPGIFHIINIVQTSNETIMLQVTRPGFEDFNDSHIDISFHFFDKDVLWVESSNLRGTLMEGNRELNPYSKDVLWHRLSGPEQQE